MPDAMVGKLHGVEVAGVVWNELNWPSASGLPVYCVTGVDEDGPASPETALRELIQFAGIRVCVMTLPGVPEESAHKLTTRSAPVPTASKGTTTRPMLVPLIVKD